jgi:hypothetical protein
MLTEDEAEAVLLGLRYVDQRGDDVLTKAADNARAKIMVVLSPEMQAVTSAPLTVSGPDGKGFPKDAVPLSIFRSAIRMQRKLIVDYVDGQQRHTQPGGATSAPAAAKRWAIASPMLRVPPVTSTRLPRNSSVSVRAMAAMMCSSL